MSVVVLNFESGSRSLEMRLDLEEDRPNEKTIIDFLKSGALYEPDECNVMVNVLRPGDTVIDVGANIGFFTILAALLVGQSGRVLSVEPDSENVERLKRNIELNDLRNVVVVTAVATNKSADSTKFFLNSDNSGGNALWDPGEWPTNDKSRANPNPIFVKSVTLDEECRRLQLATPKLIKIDTEGAEEHVLSGAQDLLQQQKVPFVLSELHEFGLQRMNSSQSSLRSMMQRFGYSTFSLFYDGTLPKHIPSNTHIKMHHIINLLFTTPEAVENIGRRPS